MPRLATPDQVDLSHTDIGSGRPIVMIHSWPLSGAAFADNTKVLVVAGYQVIICDRHGFGQPGKPRGGYDYDILAAGLDALLADLDLYGVVLLRLFMSGSEVAHYPITCGPECVGAATLPGSIRSALCITKDNPDGITPREGPQELVGACVADRTGFVDWFCGWSCSNKQGLTAPEEIRQQAVEIARRSVPHIAVATILTWTEDLRGDCHRTDVPLLVIHSDGDQNVPLAKFSTRMPEYVQQVQLVVIEGGPHRINAFYADQWNAATLSFLVGS